MNEGEAVTRLEFGYQTGSRSEKRDRYGLPRKGKEAIEKEQCLPKQGYIQFYTQPRPTPISSFVL